MNIECSLYSFCLCLSYIICTIDVSILQIPFSSPSVITRSLSAPIRSSPSHRLLLPFRRHPSVITRRSLFATPFSWSSFVSLFGRRVQVPLFLCSVNYSLL
jgi:hypothetical protein